MAVLVNETESAGTAVFNALNPLTVPATTVGNLLVGCAQYAITGRIVSSISGGLTWNVAASRLHDFNGTSGRIGIHAGICTEITTSFSINLNADSTGPDCLSLVEITLPVDPITEAGTSTENNNSGTNHTCGTVSPSAGPVIFLAYGTFGSDIGTFTEDSDFINILTPGPPVYHSISYRIQNDGAAQSYACTTSNSVTSSFVLVAIQLTSGIPVAIPFRTTISAKRI